MKFNCGHEAQAGVNGVCLTCHLKEPEELEPVKRKQSKILTKEEKRVFRREKLLKSGFKGKKKTKSERWKLDIREERRRRKVKL